MLHGIVSNHGFVDGNKRTALYLTELLAQRSDYNFIERDEVVVDVITSVARGEMCYDDLVEWFKHRLVRQVCSRKRT